jgi:hypothetical protein
MDARTLQLLDLAGRRDLYPRRMLRPLRPFWRARPIAHPVRARDERRRPLRIMAGEPQADAAAGFPLALPDGSPAAECCCVEPGCYTSGCPYCASGRTPLSYLARFSDSGAAACGLCGYRWLPIGGYDPAGYCLGFGGTSTYGGYGYAPSTCCVWFGTSGVGPGAYASEVTDVHCAYGGTFLPVTGFSGVHLFRCGSKVRLYASSAAQTACVLHFRGETEGPCDGTLSFTNTLPGTVGCFTDDLAVCTTFGGGSQPFIAARVGTSATLTPCCPEDPYYGEEI